MLKFARARSAAPARGRGRLVARAFAVKISRRIGTGLSCGIVREPAAKCHQVWLLGTARSGKP
jgi:hypothetical protein